MQYETAMCVEFQQNLDPPALNPPFPRGTTQFRRGECFVILFSITNRRSFNEVAGYIDRVRNVKDCDEIVAVRDNPESRDACRMSSRNLSFQIVAGAKGDLEEKREVSDEEAAELARSHNLQYILTSAKDGHNVAKVFETLAGLLIQRRREEAAALPTTRRKPRRLLQRANCSLQ